MFSPRQEQESKGGEPVRTLFVRGLPGDVKSREVYNLFRPYEGFQNASLSYPGEQKLPVSFVTFSNHTYAVLAMNQLQGLRFDPESHTRLRIELAKSNSKTKKRNALQREKEHEELGDNEGKENSEGENSSDMNEETVRSLFNYIYTDAEDLPSTRPNLLSQITSTHPKAHSQPNVHKNTNLSTNTPSQLASLNTNINKSVPCSTIFLGNFHASIRTQVEFALQSFEGFIRLKVSQKENSIMCWADYQNIQFSTNALRRIQELRFAAAPGKEIRIEFARNPMGTPKKAHHHPM